MITKIYERETHHRTPEPSNDQDHNAVQFQEIACQHECYTLLFHQSLCVIEYFPKKVLYYEGNFQSDINVVLLL